MPTSNFLLVDITEYVKTSKLQAYFYCPHCKMPVVIHDTSISTARELPSTCTSCNGTIDNSGVTLRSYKIDSTSTGVLPGPGGIGGGPVMP